MRLLLTALLLLSACRGSDDSTDQPATGVRLTVEWESLLDVRTIEVTDRGTYPVPLSVDPPGLRQQEIILAIDQIGPLSLHADGIGPDGAILGSGDGQVTVAAGELAPVKIVLGTPIDCGSGSLAPACVACGNGRVEPGELCDDHNLVNGDGCSAQCTLEGDVTHAFEIEQLETQTTTSATWVAVPGASLTFAPNDAAETWVVFASGKLRSSDPAEVSCEMRLMIDGVESDLFGHQTTGTTDNWAGFVSFDRIAPGLTEDPHTISLEFRAELGTTEADDLRIVAMRMPASADFQYFEADELAELTDARADLGTLAFTPSFAGDYFVFGKLDQTELPGGNTVRTWLEDDAGARHPNDSNGSSFSNGRAPWAPIFVAFSQNLDARPHAFTLRGGSSASDAAADWWDVAWDHRIPIAIGSSTVTPAGYAIAVTFDHAALVAAGQSRADGQDVRILAGATELDRVLDPDSDWNQPDTTIWFATTEALDFGAAATYYLYFGNPAAGTPPEDPALIFPLFDPFDGNELDPNLWNVEVGGPELNGGELTVGPGTTIRQLGRYLENSVWEVKSRLSFPVGYRMTWLGAAGEGISTFSWFSDDSDHHAEANGFLTHFDAPTPTDFHVWRVQRDSGIAIRFFQDRNLIVENVGDLVPRGAMQPYLANEAQQASMIYDWIRVRPYVNPQPDVALGAVESTRGGLASRWAYRKLMAFRADAFESSQYAESLDAETTTSTTFQPKAELTSDAPPGPRSYVAIQSLRISGTSDVDRRRSGELRANDQVLLATSHKINRTNEEANGYHHVAGAVDLRAESAPVRYQNGYSSPDGITVRAAESVIILLRLPE